MEIRKIRVFNTRPRFQGVTFDFEYRKNEKQIIDKDLTLSDENYDKLYKFRMGYVMIIHNRDYENIQDALVAYFDEQ